MNSDNLTVKVKVAEGYPIKTWGLPQYESEGAACFDIRAWKIVDEDNKQDIWSTSFLGSKTFHTGLYFEIPFGYVMKLYSRSGHGFKHGIRLANCTGIIDSDYRGELLVKLHNDSNDWVSIKKGDKICQAMVVPIDQVDLVLVDELSDTVRGESGFGSTGS